MPKLLFDLLPVALFFVAFKLFDVFYATAVAIAVTVAQMLWMRLKGRPIEPMQWVSFVLIVVFGGLTLWLKDETFIKWKPTVLYWAFGAAIVVGRALGKDPVRTLMQSQIALPDAAWKTFGSLWVGYFVVMGAMNLWVAQHFTTDTWATYKLFGTLGLTLVFVLVQAAWVARRMRDEPQVVHAHANAHAPETIAQPDVPHARAVAQRHDGTRPNDANPEV